ncbi:MAG TPA: RsiV family protein, partial [Paracoccaceae bacterium]|nr:RsiV family protein [Paracoccaceae bacterium]
ILQGTKDWDCFRNFSINNGNLVFYFGSYQVAAYALGHQTCTIQLRQFSPFLKDFAAHALDLAWEKGRK